MSLALSRLAVHGHRYLGIILGDRMVIYFSRVSPLSEPKVGPMYAGRKNCAAVLVERQGVISHVGENPATRPFIVQRKSPSSGGIGGVV